jgi:hypothetical protein
MYFLEAEPPLDISTNDYQSLVQQEQGSKPNFWISLLLKVEAAALLYAFPARVLETTKKIAP